MVATLNRDTALTVRPVAGALGAEIHGVNLNQPLDDALFAAIHQAFLEHLVVFFPGQALTPANLVAFSARFGEIVPPRFVAPFKMPMVEGFPEIYQIIKEPENPRPNVGGFWHADVTYRDCPNLASIGYLAEAPSFGGDTMYANLYLAYEALSPGMKRMLDGLEAVHCSTMPHAHSALRNPALSRDQAPSEEHRQFQVESVEKEIFQTVHPVVRRHPETGRKLLYVNRGFTSHFVDMTQQESLPLLEYLWAHAEQAEFTCRYHLAQGSVVIWDNRCVLHYALNDYFGQRRVLQRVSVNEPSRPTA